MKNKLNLNKKTIMQLSDDKKKLAGSDMRAIAGGMQKVETSSNQATWYCCSDTSAMGLCG